MIEGRLTLFTETDLDRLHGAVLRILDEPGVRVCHEAFLEALAAAGANVNKASGVARFPARLVEDFLDERRARARPCESPVRDHAGAYAPSVGCVIAPFLHDFERRARRPGTREDLLEIIRWADVDTPETCRVSQAVTMSDVDPRLEPIEAYALLIEHSARPPEAAFASEVDQIAFLLDMSEVYYGRRVFPHGASFMTSPLTFGDRVARYTLAAIEFGRTAFGVGVMPISGGNAPITIAGNVALSAAELIGGWLTIKSLLPEATFGGGACNGIIDMRQGVASFNAPEALLSNLGVAELFERRYGGGVGVAAGADYIDARLPGLQAAYERTYRAMAIAACTGRPFHMGGTGTLDGGKIFSPVQFIIERELGEGLWRLGQGIHVDDEMLAVEAIRAVGVGEGKSYLDAPHTFAHFRDTWLPQFIERRPWADDATEFGSEAHMLEAAHQRYKGAVARYTPPTKDEDKLEGIRRIVERAREEL